MKPTTPSFALPCSAATSGRPSASRPRTGDLEGEHLPQLGPAWGACRSAIEQPKRSRSSSGRYTRPQARSSLTSWQCSASCSAVQMLSERRTVSTLAARTLRAPAPDGVRRECAVGAQLLPGLITLDALVGAVGLDQPQERLARQAAFAERWLQGDEQRMLRPAREGQVRSPAASPELPADRRERVPELVHEPGEPVDREQVGALATRQQATGYGEVLAARTRHHCAGAGTPLGSCASSVTPAARPLRRAGHPVPSPQRRDSAERHDREDQPVEW